ncbi:MAG: CmcI family methyltransferase [Bacteroidales bacterium]
MLFKKEKIGNMFFRASRIPGLILYYLRENHRHGHGIHSPFMFRFIREVLEVDAEREKFEQIEYFRREVYHDPTPVIEVDPGAGSFGRPGQSGIGRKARTSSLRPSTGRLLSRIVEDQQPEICLELGTSVGLGSMYLALGAPETEVITIEGNSVLANAARIHAERLGFNNIKVIHGLFSEELDKLETKGKMHMVVWLDGDHRGEALLENMKKLMDIAAPGSIVVVDDIRWSSSMYRAWKTIIREPGIPVSLDLWKMGILFLFNGLHKQHYQVKF